MNNTIDEYPINNFAEFILARGYEWHASSMYEYGRNFYKYGFGGWVSYVVEDAPARDVEYKIVVRANENNEAVRVGSMGVPERVLQFFGLEAGAERYAFDAYYDLLVDYNQTGDGGVGPFEYSRSYDDNDEIVITGMMHFDATTRDVYYEDDEARTESQNLNVIGVKIGSIIEGADYDATPITSEFPFTNAEYDQAMSDLELEVNEEWKKNNTTYYSISDDSGDKVYWCAWEAFDDDPTGNFEPSDDPFALKVARAAGNMVFEGDSGAIEGFPGYSVKEEVMDW